MFQPIEFQLNPQDRKVIDTNLKTEYKGGITGITVWCPRYEDMRRIELELRINGTEVFPASFPAELYSQNQFRDTESGVFRCTFPERSKIEGVIYNSQLDSSLAAANVKLIFYTEFE
jgi:hypothetical protein